MTHAPERRRAGGRGPAGAGEDADTAGEGRPAGRTGRGRRALRLGAAALLLAGGWLLAADGPQPLVAQQAQEDYEVERGDTLWDIADRLLQDPFRWQQIWKANQSRIDDPDLIFPGQRFAIPGAEGRAAGVADREAAGEQQAAGREGERAEAPDAREAGDARTDTVAGARPSLFESGRRGTSVSSGGFSAEERPALRPLSESEVLGAPFVAPRRQLEPLGRVLGPVTAGERPTEVWQGRAGDEIRVGLGGIDASAGDTLFSVEVGRSLGDRGRTVHPTGVLRVESVSGDTARASVGQVYGLLRSGDAVVRTPVPVVPPGTDFRPAEREMSATMLESAEGGALLREGGLVFLDRGSSGGVRPGDVFVAAPGEAEGERGERIGARVIVVRVRPETSTARVIHPGDGTVSPGAAARLVRRMAASGR